MADKEVTLTLKVDAAAAIKAIKEEKEAIKKLKEEEKARNEEQKKINKEEKERASAVAALAKQKQKALEKQLIAEQKQTKQQKLEAQAANAVIGSYDQLSAQYRLNVIQLNQVNTTVGEATGETIQLVNETADLKTKMNDAKKAINDFTQQVGDYRDESQKASTQTNSFGSIAKKSFKAVGTVGKTAFRGIGLAFKAMGIGIVIAAFSALFEALKKNQKVMDAFQTVTNAIGLVIRPLIDGIGDLIEGISSGSKEFDAIGKVIKALINLALIPLRISFNRIKLGIQFLILGWLEVKKAFGGDVDEGKIEELRKNIDKTKESTKELLKEAKESAKAIVDNVGEAIEEVGALGNKVADGMKKAVEDVKNGAARAATEAAKALELLDAEQEKLKLQFQKRAEVFRQIRDDESKSIAERITANEDLGKVLLEQAESETAAVNKKIAAQQMLNNINGKTIEGDKALAELRNELLEIDERVNSQQSEQLVNLNSLNKEKLELERNFLVAKQELINDMALEAAETELERELLKAEQDAEKKELELEKMILDSEERTELEALLLEQKENTLQEIRDRFGKEKLDKQKDLDNKELQAKKTSQKAINNVLSGGLKVLAGFFGESKALQIAAILSEKAQAIASIFIKTQKSNATNLASAIAIGPPQNVPLIATAKVQNAAQNVLAGINTAAIAGTTKFANGGYHYGATHAGGGIDLGNGVEVQNREFTVNDRTMSNPQLAGIVETANAIGNGQGGSINMGVSREEALEIAQTTVLNSKVYIVESEMTDMQNKVGVRESEFNG